MKPGGPKILGCIRAEAILLKSSDKAIILEYFRWSINFKENRKDYNPQTSKYFHGGFWWCQISFEALSDLMPWLSERCIKNYIKDLCDAEILIKRRSSEFGGGNKPNFYRVDEDTLSAKLAPTPLSAESAQTGCKTCTPLSAESAPTLLYTYNPTHIHLNPVSSPSPEILDLAKRWHDFALREMKWTTPPESWSVDGFAKEIIEVMEVENINITGMDELLTHIERGWWAQIITTPASLLKTNDEKQRRSTTILKQMKPKSVRDQERDDALSEEEKEQIDNNVAILFGFKKGKS